MIAADPASRSPPAPRRTGRTLAAASLAIAVGLLAVVALLNRQATIPPPPATAPAAPSPAPTAAPSGPRHPIENVRTPVEPARPLPPLDGSDAAVRTALDALFSGAPLDRILVSDDLVRRFVATVDNLPRHTVAERLRPVRPAPGLFVTEGTGDALAVGAGNAARYATYLRLVESADPRSLVDVYVRYYPLFQQAYRDLGYPTGYFNDRLIEAIDSVLATPDVAGPLPLAQPKVLYEFADPSLEALASGQKALLRLGPANAAAVKAKLWQIRALLAGDPPR